MFGAMARDFPVACASDEFIYFPQVRLPEPQWDVWDRYSAASVEGLVRRLSSQEAQLERLRSDGPGVQDRIDINLLCRMASALREQLTEVRAWESQPTLYLATVVIGIAEALASEDPAAVHDRVRTLPDFLNDARRNLVRVPASFRDLGLAMRPGTERYLSRLARERSDLHLAPVSAGLQRLAMHLQTVPGGGDVRLPADLVARIFECHTGCDVELEQIRDELAREAADMRAVLDQQARERLARHPVPAVGTEGLLGLYSGEIDRLARHCVDQGWVAPDVVSGFPVRVARVPAQLSGIRTASSYAISPGDPPCEGVFYVLEADAGRSRLSEYRMLAAHETYPGHHLLDVFRRRLARPVRRAIERPLFYEGWACFAEHLMRETGYLAGPVDHLLLAKRRMWRAVRGQVDLGLHTGTMDLAEAAACLCETGLNAEQAMSAARKYSLKPGYQVCYTLGLRYFLDLFERHGRDRARGFVNGVLKYGEVPFADLDALLAEE